MFMSRSEATPKSSSSMLLDHKKCLVEIEWQLSDMDLHTPLAAAAAAFPSDR
jgi:hypothetical protein